MSVTAIFALVIAVLLALAIVAVALPRSRRAAEERKLQRRREAVADRHRDVADERLQRAEEAEQVARLERAEAERHAARAELHRRGMADDVLQQEHDALVDRDGDGRHDDGRGDDGGNLDRAHDAPARDLEVR